MGILGLWHLACPDAACRDATVELMLWQQLQSRKRPTHTLWRVQHTLHSKPVCWEQCAKHCQGLLLGMVLYQRRVNKFKTDLSAFMKTTFFVVVVKETEVWWFVGKRKMWEVAWVFFHFMKAPRVGGLPADGEAHPHLPLPSPASLGSLQSLWPTLKEKLGPYL